ncbi:DUF771 domain-containing protein [Paenibacillus vini]|uniref:DUF771 domain-containing protein n=1 Tax=Paenibacillus vini TaxID=1476024 RepID=UPI0025B662F9|nr:DUF771 domain-containing protein [Paenibacillus vini]MDN4069235.1 DUF771 domain-containing protein [Paenibacillus vini]MDN4069288.1 DUF771 domain-containing protein [Paenibacillus vini]
METTSPLKITIDDQMIMNLARDEIRRILAESGEGAWWDMKRLEAETCRKRDWLIENILLNPVFREEMKLISNDREGGRWIFKGAEMRAFLDKHFHHLNRKNN